MPIGYNNSRTLRSYTPISTTKINKGRLPGVAQPVGNDSPDFREVGLGLERREGVEVRGGGLGGGLDAVGALGGLRHLDLLAVDDGLHAAGVGCPLEGGPLEDQTTELVRHHTLQPTEGVHEPLVVGHDALTTTGGAHEGREHQLHRLGHLLLERTREGGLGGGEGRAIGGGDRRLAHGPVAGVDGADIQPRHLEPSREDPRPETELTRPLARALAVTTLPLLARVTLLDGRHPDGGRAIVVGVLVELHRSGEAQHPDAGLDVQRLLQLVATILRLLDESRERHGLDLAGGEHLPERGGGLNGGLLVLQIEHGLILSSSALTRLR